MILTGPQIALERAAGRLEIDPFDPAQLGPHSYDYRLGDLIRWQSAPGIWQEQTIPETGIVLLPGRHYLGSTVERMGSTHYVPSLIGRSTLGRLGMFLQAAADLGNLGAIHCWTLEISVVQPLRMYAGVRVGQVSFWAVKGRRRQYDGRYDQFSVPTTSLEEEP